MVLLEIEFRTVLPKGGFSFGFSFIVVECKV